MARRRMVKDSLEQVEIDLALKRQQKEIENKQYLSSSDTAGKFVDSAFVVSEYGMFQSGAIGEKTLTVLKNDKISLKLSNLGAKVYSAELLGYKTFDSLPLVLFSGDSTVFGFGISQIGKNTDQLFFEQVQNGSQFDASESEQTVSYKLSVDENNNIEYVYTLKPGEYQVKLNVRINGLQSIARDRFLSFEWEMYSPKQEKGRQWESDNTTIHYKYFEDEDNSLNARSDEESEEMTGRVKWIAYKQQFFSVACIADSYFSKGSRLSYRSLPTSEKHLKYFSSIIDVPLDAKEIGFSFYFGPNHYPTLKAQGNSLERLIPLGWGIFGWVNKFVVIPLFNWLSSFLTNYGLIILLLTIIIKLILFPLTFKSYLSTARMRVLKPEVDEISAKYDKKDQMMKRQQETMALYKKAGVNPMGGCLPMLVQMPILFAMFRFFPASIELRQKAFLWATDLSTYDSILNLPFEIPFYGDHVSLFTLLMALSMIATTKLNGSQMTQAPGQPNMQVVMWMMPAMMLFWFNSYSSGLSYYYFIANMITLGQTYLIRYFIDDEAILAKIKANKKKPAKQSKFQERLEKMAKERGLR